MACAGDAQHPLLLSEIEVTSGGQTSRYQLPFGLLGEDQFTSALPQQLALARVRRVRQVGLITDAFSLDEAISVPSSTACAHQTVLSSSDGEIRFEPTPHLADLPVGDELQVRYLAAEQSNSSVVVGEEAWCSS